MTTSLTRQIWRAFSSNIDERAEAFKEAICNILRSDLSGDSYLDIGGGLGVNAAIIGKDFKHIYSVDRYIPQEKRANVTYLIGDAHNLKHSNNTFELVTLFSVIEHVASPEVVLKEAVRVLKEGGILVLQFPNWHFPIDLHTGLPNPFILPKSLREKILKRIGYEFWLSEVFFIRPRTIIKYLSGKCELLALQSFIYPSSLVPSKFRCVYQLYTKSGFLKIYPMSYICAFRKLH